LYTTCDRMRKHNFDQKLEIITYVEEVNRKFFNI